MKLLNKKTIIVIFVLILAMGLFLRTYKFHDWLYFSSDQVRDANLVSSYLKGDSLLPLLGPTMRKSTDSKAELFHLGPIYYHFQILSAKIFGNYPDKLAYPDLLFFFWCYNFILFFSQKVF